MCMKLLERALEADFPVDDFCREIKVRMSYSTKLFLIYYLIGLAHSDKDPRELEELNRLSLLIGVDNNEFREIKESWHKQISENT